MNVEGSLHMPFEISLEITAKMATKIELLAVTCYQALQFLEGSQEKTWVN